MWTAWDARRLAPEARIVLLESERSADAGRAVATAASARRCRPRRPRCGPAGATPSARCRPRRRGGGAADRHASVRRRASTPGTAGRGDMQVRRRRRRRLRRRRAPGPSGARRPPTSGGRSPPPKCRPAALCSPSAPAPSNRSRRCSSRPASRSAGAAACSRRASTPPSPCWSVASASRRRGRGDRRYRRPGPRPRGAGDRPRRQSARRPAPRQAHRRLLPHRDHRAGPRRAREYRLDRRRGDHRRPRPRPLPPRHPDGRIAFGWAAGGSRWAPACTAAPRSTPT